MESEHGKTIEGRVDHCQTVAQKSTDGDAQHGANQGDQQDQFDIVPADLQIRITKRLDRRNLFPLDADQARHHHVQQERRDREEDARRDQAHAAQLLDLVRDVAVRDMIVAARGASRTVPSQQVVQPLDDRLFRGAACQRQRHVVERPVHVERGRQLLVAHPKHAETAVVGQQVGPVDLDDVFGRQRNADDPQLLAAAVDHRRHPVPDLQPVRIGERLAYQHLAGAPRFDPSASTEMQIVDHRRPPLGDRDHPSDRRLGHVRHVQRHVHDDPSLYLSHARDLRHPLPQRPWRPFDLREQMREAVLGVVRLLRLLQGIQGAERHHKRAHAGSDHQCDRHRLALDGPQIANRFAVQGSH